MNYMTTALCLFFFINCSNKNQNYEINLYFGLSKPDGGVVTTSDWNEFEDVTISKYFDGFNVIESLGFYKGVQERSKLVTIILNDSNLHKVDSIAQAYAKEFDQESVMMVKLPILDWQFISANKNKL